MRLTIALLGAALALGACSDTVAPPEDRVLESDRASFSAAVAGTASPAAFTHGIELSVDGADYYFAGPPDGPGGARDIPGHSWAQAGPSHVVGRHVNTGPNGASQWWSSDAGDGELLYIVDGIVDTWSPEKAAAYAKRGYIHYHELVSADGGDLHPSKIVWLKHTARTFFTLDGGPHPEASHEVSPGIDLEFLPNGMTPYPG
ncbi:MAG: hypothetical protein GWM90_09780 [Gemmatimonadetes bacterium]|nr:hypothetical protein [Gemmatimonadota bacterium]NIQ53751.1 hypothetical protein [Gemmatimonadota bacterium]NIU74408.1 hypothetical protein [Gammaproteobacteria bacterium]NIX44394.1 hypothetical protein [Gemmatimonadota bacterium]NIY08612.1 hypothetical protein [Gemmatimonadota bacterium]